MTYYVNKTNGVAIVIPDGTKDTTSTSLVLLGRLASNYGENQNENFVRLLENFAFSTSPTNPITGQLWYDTVNTVMKVYDSASGQWTSIGSNTQGNSAITGNLLVGPTAFEIQEVAGSVKLINKSNNANIAIFATIGGTSTSVLNVQGSTGLITVAGNATNNLGVTTKSYVDSYVDSLTANAASQASTLNTLSGNIATIQSNISSLSTNVNSLSSGTGAVNSKEISLNGNLALGNSGTGNVAIDIKTPGGVTILSAQGSLDTAAPVTRSEEPHV